MTQTLKYHVENAQLAKSVRNITYDGADAVVTIERALIEALPLDSNGVVDPEGRTFSCNLPVEALNEIGEGAVISVTIEVATPAPAPTA